MLKDTTSFCRTGNQTGNLLFNRVLRLCLYKEQQRGQSRSVCSVKHLETMTQQELTRLREELLFLLLHFLYSIAWAEVLLKESISEGKSEAYICACLVHCAQLHISLSCIFHIFPTIHKTQTVPSVVIRHSVCRCIFFSLFHLALSVVGTAPSANFSYTSACRHQYKC